MIRTLTVLLLVVVTGCGCGIPPEAKTQATLSRTRSEQFIRLMDAGQTTRDQEKAFIKAEAAMWAALDKALGGVDG